MEDMDKYFKDKPNIKSFLYWISKKHPKIILNNYQIGLGKSYIDFRNKTFSGGIRSGRTFVLDKVKQYYLKEYPYAEEQ